MTERIRPCCAVDRPAARPCDAARQGLLERLSGDPAEVVQAVGAIQSQQWSAVAAGLWARAEKFAPDELYAALSDGALVTGTLLRRTLHLCSRVEHPAYALVADTTGGQRVVADEPASLARCPVASPRPVDLLRVVARTVEETSAFIETWLDARPGVLSDAELAEQRAYGWRPYRSGSDFLRAPANGRWGPRTPSGFLAAPAPPSLDTAPDRDAALDAVVRRHPAGVRAGRSRGHRRMDGPPVPTVRAAINASRRRLVTYEGEDGRRLHDLPGAPLPDEDTPAPAAAAAVVRRSPDGFAPTRRTRVLAHEHRDAVYSRANLQVGRRSWWTAGRRHLGGPGDRTRVRAHAAAVRPAPRRTTTELVEEADPLVRLLAPASRRTALPSPRRDQSSGRVVGAGRAADGLHVRVESGPDGGTGSTVLDV